MIARKMPHVTVFTCLLLLLWQLIFLNFTEAQQDVIECRIKDGDDIIHLKWMKTSRSLVNEHLPIWIATPSKEKDSQGVSLIQYELKRNFLSEYLGDFTLYHDDEKSSAIVYYHNEEVICGMIDTRYTIKMLPRRVCDSGIPVGEEYVRAYEKANEYHDFKIELDPSKRRNGENSASSSTSNQYQHPKKISRISSSSNKLDTITLYPENLVVIPHDVAITMEHNNLNELITRWVEYYIAYFNAIDMLFAKLSTENIKIHINLAGIIIESQEGLLNFKTCEHCVQAGVQEIYSETDNTYLLISEHLDKNRHIFPEDSYDFVLLPSRYKLCSSGEEKNKYLFGVSWECRFYDERQYGRRRSSVSMVHHGTVTEYVVATHEIAHLMTIEHDIGECGVYYGGCQCYAIMQEVGIYCPKCLHWSEKSIEHLKNYVSRNRSHCFLLNYPRSLYPYGTPIKTLTPSKQCRCYGYKPLNPLRQHPGMVPETGCNEILGCDTDGDRVETILPIDGTPCGDDKVCWNRRCVPINPSRKPGTSRTHCHRGQ